MLKRLVGSGDRIGLLLLPFLVGGLILNLAFPEFFAVGGPPDWLAAVSVVVLVVGVVIWLWSVYLILTRVPRGELITSGPYRLMKHPLYTGVALFVLPWAGFLLNTWLGVVLGIVLYLGDRLYAPAEEADLAERFGPRWEAYSRRVLLPWI
jgi:protein-S-isoprenylcysteine O-methyltransferase Ste14